MALAITPVAASSAPAAAAESGSTLFGASVLGNAGLDYNGALRAADDKYGGMDIVRIFSSGNPAAWRSDRPTSHLPAVVSFRYEPQAVLEGKADAYMRDWFDKAPKDRLTYWVYSHEPENDIERGEFSAQQYRAAWTRIAGLADEAKNPKLKATLNLMCWSFNPKSGRDWRDYYAGADVIDVLAFDCYNWMARKGGYAPPENVYGNAVSTAQELGIPFGIAETGSLLVDGDDGSGRAAWLRDVGAWLVKNKAQFVTYFDIALRPESDYRLRDAPSVAAWRSYCS